MTFKGHFSEGSHDYQAFRPDYPEALFGYIANIAPSRQRAWDCATGTGQAAIQLAQYFENVIANDSSAEQINAASPHTKIIYAVARETNPAIDDASVDLITVAQALHWLDLDRFFSEVKRVLKPEGVLAVWSYNLLSVSPEIDKTIGRFYYDVLGDYWPPERKLVESGYRDIELPYPELSTPEFNIQKQWNLNTLCGYFGTWSAYKRYVQATDTDPMHNLKTELKQAWDESDQAKTASCPITLKVCKKFD